MKKARVTETVNSNVKKMVMIQKQEEDVTRNDEERSEDGSEDSAISVKDGDGVLEKNDETVGAPGSVADREKRKWVEKAVALSNNPYTQESIDSNRRKSSSNNGEFVSLRYLLTRLQFAIYNVQLPI